jgi:dTDP-4-dehydrorhamnose reductase
MKALLTGMNGTVAPVLAESLAASGYAFLPWDRELHPIDNREAVEGFIVSESPDLLCHLAMGSPDWTEWMAQICAERDIPFLFTSTVSVFSSSQVGPFSIEDTPQPQDDYGRYKLECEQRIQAANPNAWIVRLGWQIGSSPGGNHMVDYLDRTYREKGVIEASTEWFPGCSFLPDTAETLTTILEGMPSGLYHLDGNPGLSFHEIALGLNRLQGNPWKVVPAANLVQNHRMLDPRVTVAPITRWISA